MVCQIDKSEDYLKRTSLVIIMKLCGQLCKTCENVALLLILRYCLPS